MAKRLRTTSALAVVVMLLVGACGSSHDADTGCVCAARVCAGFGCAERICRAERAACVGPAGGGCADGPDRLHRAGPALGADKPFNGKTGLDPDPVDRRRRHQLRCLGRRLRDGDRHHDPDRQHRLEPRDRAEDPHRRWQAAGPGDARPADARPGLRRRRQGHRRGDRSWTPTRSSATEHPATIGLVTQGANIWGIPYKADVKSTIWYPIKAFEAKGYAVPTTWDELIALSDKIVADGSNPWCVSAGGPGTATGWQITDWVEEVVLKTKGLAYYNDWISHKVTFQDQGIKDAFDK